MTLHDARPSTATGTRRGKQLLERLRQNPPDLRGPLGSDVKRYYQAARAEAFDRIPLFRLAWDTALSAFGAQQVLYERLFFGDPVRLASTLTANHSKEILQYAEKVRSYVAEAQDDAFAQAV